MERLLARDELLFTNGPFGAQNSRSTAPQHWSIWARTGPAAVQRAARLGEATLPAETGPELPLASTPVATVQLPRTGHRLHRAALSVVESRQCGQSELSLRLVQCLLCGFDTEILQFSNRSSRSATSVTAPISSRCNTEPKLSTKVIGVLRPIR